MVVERVAHGVELQRRAAAAGKAQIERVGVAFRQQIARWGGRVRPQLIEAPVELQHQPSDPSLHADASAGELRQACRVVLETRHHLGLEGEAVAGVGARRVPRIAQRGGDLDLAQHVAGDPAPDRPEVLGVLERGGLLGTQLELEEVGGRLGRAREQHDGGNEPHLVGDDLVDAGRQRVEEEMPLLVGDRAGDGELGDLVGVDASRFERPVVRAHQST